MLRKIDCVMVAVDDLASVPPSPAIAGRSGCHRSTAVGRCAVLEDPFGNAVCILDLSRGPRSDVGVVPQQA